MITTEDIGKRVRILNQRDIAINGELRKFLDNDEHTLMLERITKGGRAILKHEKQTYSLAPRDVEVFTRADD